MRWRARDLAVVAGLAAIYFGAAKLSFGLSFGHATAVWPPTGIAVASLLLIGIRVWPGVLIGALAATALNDLPLDIAGGVALGNTLGPIACALLLRRVLRVDLTLARLRDVFGLLISAVAAMTLTASNGLAQLSRAPFIPASEYGTIWWNWWVGDVMGVMIVGTLLLSWAADRRFPWRGWRAAEAVALFASLVAGCRFIFESPPETQIQYAVFPFIIWSALRFGVRETATAIAIISGAAIWGSIHDLGPFGSGARNERLALLEIFMAVVTMAGLSLSVVTSERRRAEDELQRAHDELEVRVQERTAALGAANAELASKNEEVEAFVYIVSHDLRAPLVNLQGFARELQLSRGELAEKLAGASLPAGVRADLDAILRDGMDQALRFISASTAKFERLIDALLHLSRYGRERYRPETVDVNAVVETTLASLRQSIETSGAKVSVAGALPAAFGDATAIGQVFSNLIGNAIAYLKPGRPGVIEIGGEASGASNRYWVRDNGVGIGAASLPRLFQVFQRFHPELAPGDGMGLAIVKRVVERHGGQVRAESKEDVGTAFHLTLPAPRA